MSDKRKFSLFISSTYEDLKKERQALMGVALENNFIPVGMEQFHAAPASQWTVITRMIDQCDFYLLVVGGRYGSIDELSDISYTEKEYKYAKEKGIPTLVLIKNASSITDDKKDTDDEKYDKYEKMKRLDSFRKKVKNDGNTVDAFNDLNDLKYKATQALKNAQEYADKDAGWVRYKDIAEVINEEAELHNKTNSELSERQLQMMESMKALLTDFGDKLSDFENNQLQRGEIPTVSNEDIERLFNSNNVFDFGDEDESIPTVGQDDVDSIPLDSVFLLVYAADGDGRIMKIQTLGSPMQITVSGKRFMIDNSERESARWEEALDQLIEWGWVKPVGYKNQVFKITGTGYNKADWLKKGMGIDTSKDPLEELSKFKN